MGCGSEKRYHHQHHHHLKFHVQFHLPFHHHHDDDELKDIPRGCVAVMVGQGDEQQQRFVIPVMYINHPLFMELLKGAEEEYGFDHNGPITIPCHVEEFRYVEDVIDKENAAAAAHHHHHHNHNHHLWCFTA